MFIPSWYRKLKRGPQVILPKDIGMVLAYTGVGRDSRCLDAGTGSGWLAVALANVAKEVVSYDVREEFISIAEKNKKMKGLENLNIKLGDVTAHIEETEMDLVTLDMPNSDLAVPNAAAALKDGGHIFGYMPHTEQVKKFVEAMELNGFTEINVFESIVRDMLVRREGVRPSTKGVWHTGYLVFGRKKDR
jgi:tRNA (adenine57-N1/adenine58-N1)-methyltransferase